VTASCFKQFDKRVTLITAFLFAAPLNENVGRRVLMRSYDDRHHDSVYAFGP
jgi:hypothetical protein